MNKYIEMTKGLNDKQLREVIGIMASASADANGALLDYLEKQGLVTPEQEKAQQIRTRKAEAAFRDIWLDASIVLEAMDDGDWEELTARGFTDYYFEDANIDSQVSRLEEIANKEPLSAEFRVTTEMREPLIWPNRCVGLMRKSCALQNSSNSMIPGARRKESKESIADSKKMTN